MVLLDLCIHAWRHEDNEERAPAGLVLRKHSSLAAIQRTTGLSKRAVQDALETLRRAGYVITRFRPGYGNSQIMVFWTEGADQMRADYRAGIKPLLKDFQKDEKEPRKPLEVVREGNIIQFPKVQE